MTALLLPGGGQLAFELPDELAATGPPEARGLARDQVRLMVASRTTGDLVDTWFRRLPGFLAPGDLLVVNTSGTLPAALPAGADRLVHLSTRLPDGHWIVEPRRRAGAGSLRAADGHAGQALALPGGGRVRLLEPYPAGATAPVRLWRAELRVPGGLHAYLLRHGQPIRYGYTAGPWPLAAYQTVYATEPGSAEMPSAGRAFTRPLLAALRAKGIGVAGLVLHTGVSSQDAGEPPHPEPYRVPAATAARVNAARAAGRRVVAVGTTVTRALETVADAGGRVHAGEGWTGVVVTPERGVRAVDGILTGWHAPGASHLALLQAVGGRELLARSYAAALAWRYRWHEFGDLHLILRDPSPG
ncbi:MAG TPA: S-adenosylmethionine:tRNA ribosyltransferase-isomerase [Actinomycetes bacterium]|nr:S-adenosylmethionine:tRNA ribosyltransferase-isomerase [Actinomycetes bacterium]